MRKSQSDRCTNTAKAFLKTMRKRCGGIIKLLVRDPLRRVAALASCTKEETELHKTMLQH